MDDRQETLLKVTASGLLIPGHMNDEPRYHCNIPGCDWVGYNAREQVAHAQGHANDEDLMHELSRSPVAEIMGEGTDPERQKYLEDRYRKLLPQVGPKEALDPRRY